MINVWHCWVVRPQAAFFAAQFGLLAVLALWRFPTDSVAGWMEGNRGVLLVLAACQASFYLNNLDNLVVDRNFNLFLTKTVKALAGGLAVAWALFLLFPRLAPGYPAGLSAALLSAMVLLSIRPLMGWLVRRRKMVEGVLIVGTGELARKLHRELVSAGTPVKIRGFLTDQPGFASSGVAEGQAIHYSELRDLILKHRVSRIVVADPNPQTSEELTTALVDCKLRGLEIEQAVDSYEKMGGKIWLEALRPEWLIYSDGFRQSKYYLRLKSFMDLAGAAALILLTAPVLALAAAAIKLDTRGPVLFRQVRVGKHGRRFVLYKFRSMREDAEQHCGPTWAREGDSRVTRVGRVLRKYRLDELPQAFNILRGEMSLVGPRPERPYFVNLLSQRVPYYDLRHYVKPGATGWAQVRYPYGASIEDAYEKLQYDLYYAKNMSLSLDLLVLLKTLRVVLFGRGR